MDEQEILQPGGALCGVLRRFVVVTDSQRRDAGRACQEQTQAEKQGEELANVLVHMVSSYFLLLACGKKMDLPARTI